MFLDRPDVDFGVELANIGFDNFGIEDWLHDMVEDAIQEKLVYPGNSIKVEKKLEDFL